MIDGISMAAFAKPVLWDSFKNLLGWAFKQI